MAEDMVTFSIYIPASLRKEIEERLRENEARSGIRASRNALIEALLRKGLAAAPG